MSKDCFEEIDKELETRSVIFETDTDNYLKIKTLLNREEFMHLQNRYISLVDDLSRKFLDENIFLLEHLKNPNDDFKDKYKYMHYLPGSFLILINHFINKNFTCMCKGIDQRCGHYLMNKETALKFDVDNNIVPLLSKLKNYLEIPEKCNIKIFSNNYHEKEDHGCSIKFSLDFEKIKINTFFSSDKTFTIHEDELYISKKIYQE